VTKLEKISDTIIAEIEAGVLREGDQLPSEEKLAANYRVSVGTVQKALARLAQSGLISREHGRGTFVSGATVAPAEVRYLRFRDAEGTELPSYVHVRSVRRTTRKGAWSEFLGGERFVRIERSINVGSRLELYSEFWLREEEFARLGGVSRQALEKNLRELLGKQLSLPTLRADQWIRFAPLPPAAARVLGLDAGQPGFMMELRGYTLRDRALYYQCIYSGPFSEQLVIVR
jgi:GntR family transcriptional regulator